MEYQVDHGRVDEALLDEAGAPLVFVEAKRQGNLSVKAEDQLFRYAAHNGVPVLVLTDGDIWDLYLSMAKGKPKDRRFAHLALSESRTLTEMADDLRQFLERDRVLSGSAEDAAKERLKLVRDRAVGKAGLQPAWKNLLDEPDEILRDLLIERVEQDSGARPWPRDAEEFLHRQRSSTPDGAAAAIPTDPVAWLAASPAGLSMAQRSQIQHWLIGAQPRNTSSQQLDGQELRGFVIGELEYRTDSAAAAVRKLASVLQDRDPSFLGRWSDFNPSGKIKRPRAVQAGHVVLSTQDKRYYRELKEHPGWWLFSHGSNRTMTRRLKNMTTVAGLAWDSDVSPILE